jgi:hypothetical protein
MVIKYYVFNKRDELILTTSDADDAITTVKSCNGYILTKDDMKVLDRI